MLTIPYKFRKSPLLTQCYRVGYENPRSITTIARDIRRDWKTPYFAAVPYLDAMWLLQTMNDKYGAESAGSVIAYFLANASTYRGEIARQIKAELQGMLDARSNKRLTAA